MKWAGPPQDKTLNGRGKERKEDGVGSPKKGERRVRPLLYPRRESNPDRRFRKPLFYPLNYKGASAAKVRPFRRKEKFSESKNGSALSFSGFLPPPELSPVGRFRKPLPLSGPCKSAIPEGFPRLPELAGRPSPKARRSAVPPYGLQGETRICFQNGIVSRKICIVLFGKVKIREPNILFSPISLRTLPRIRKRGKGKKVYLKY